MKLPHARLAVAAILPLAAAAASTHLAPPAPTSATPNPTASVQAATNYTIHFSHGTVGCNGPTPPFAGTLGVPTDYELPSRKDIYEIGPTASGFDPCDWASSGQYYWQCRLKDDEIYSCGNSGGSTTFFPGNNIAIRFKISGSATLGEDYELRTLELDANGVVVEVPLQLTSPACNPNNDLYDYELTKALDGNGNPVMDIGTIRVYPVLDEDTDEGDEDVFITIVEAFELIPGSTGNPPTEGVPINVGWNNTARWVIHDWTL